MMNRCVQNCFFSSDTVTLALSWGIAGAVIGAFATCAAAGTITAGAGVIACAPASLDLALLGALIGIAAALVFALVQCGGSCAAAPTAGNTSGEQELDAVDPQPSPAEICEGARKALEAAEVRLANAEAIARNRHATTFARYASTATHVSGSVALFGLLTSPYITALGLILIPTFRLLYASVHARILSDAADEPYPMEPTLTAGGSGFSGVGAGLAGTGALDPMGVSLRRRLRDEAKQRVEEVCSTGGTRKSDAPILPMTKSNALLSTQRSA